MLTRRTCARLKKKANMNGRKAAPAGVAIWLTNSCTPSMPTTKPTRLAVMRRKMFTAAKEAHVWRYCQVSFQGRTWTGGEG